MYRQDIDGLRTLAVLPVIFYHFNIPFITGGFIGVDVFFVISGFLITRLILKEIQLGSFSIRIFYERRIRRIFPALFFITALSLIAAHLIFMPQNYKDFGQSLAALGLFSSNFLFYFESGYFDTQSTIKPLLHTWSLSVEEQFYVVMPILLLLLYRFVNRLLFLVLLFLAFCSFLFSVYITPDKGSFAFYMPFSRAWELLVGSLLAIYLVKYTPTKIASVLLSISGLALLIYSYTNISEAQQFPGYIVALPVLASALLIVGGANASNEVSRIYTSRAFIYVGKISYSLYLVHWPIVVFWIYYTDNNISIYETALLLFASLLLAHLSWRYIERPFRDRNYLSSNTVLVLGTSMLLAFVLIGATISSTNGLPNRLSDQARDASSFLENPNRAICHQKSPEQIANGEFCTLGENQDPDFVLFGDSHGDALSPAISNAIIDTGNSVAVFTRGGCRPFISQENLKRQCGRFEDGEFITKQCSNTSVEACNNFNHQVSKKINEIDPSTVILSARWAGQFYGTGSQNSDYCYSDSELSECSQENNKATFEKWFANTLDQFDDRNVLIIGPTPEYRQSIPQTAGKAAMFGRSPYVGDQAYVNRGREPQAIIENLISKRQNVTLVDLYPLFCPDKTCQYLHRGKTLYSDAHHISLFGNTLIQPQVAAAIQKLEIRKPQP